MAYSSGGGYTTIAQVFDISGPEIEYPQVKITNNSSPLNPASQEYIQGLLDGGVVSFKLYVPTNASEVAALYALQGTYTWKLTWPQGSVWTFSAFIRKFKAVENTEKAVEFEMELKLSGLPTFTA